MSDQQRGPADASRSKNRVKKPSTLLTVNTLAEQVCRAEHAAQVRKMEVIAFFEGTTLLLLLALGLPLKYVFGWPVGVQAMGPIHGIAFLFYVWTVVQTAAEANWGRAETLREILLAFIPFGAFASARSKARTVADSSPSGVQ